MKSLWWFYQNLPLCKTLPQGYEHIRETCPAIVRDKVIDLMSIVNNNKPVFHNIDLTTRVVYQGGSGRILKNSSYSKSFDESVDAARDTNNNGGFRRSTSTACLNTVQGGHAKILESREA